MNFKASRQSGIPTKFGGGNYGSGIPQGPSSNAADVSFGLSAAKLACSTAQRGHKVRQVFENSISDGLATDKKHRRSRSASRQSVYAASARRSLFGSTSQLDAAGANTSMSRAGTTTAMNRSVLSMQNPVRSWKQDPRRDPKDDREYRLSIVSRIRSACCIHGRMIDAKALEHPVANTFYEVFDTLANGAVRVCLPSGNGNLSASASMLQYSMCGGSQGMSQGANGPSGVHPLPICNVLPKEKSDPRSKKAEMEERNKQVINALMLLGYPLVVARDLNTVSAGHSWPRLLLSLSFLADCCSYSRAIHVDRLLFPRNPRVFQEDASGVFDQPGGDDSGVDEDARAEFQLLGDMFRLFLRDDNRGQVQRIAEFRDTLVGRYETSIRDNEEELERLQAEFAKVESETQSLTAVIDAASEKKKRVAGKEQQCNELQTSLEVAEKELANLRADVAGLKQEHDTLTQRSNELRATVRNQERAQLNAKQISEERCTLERELNALENGRCNIEQQANSVELQISEQARVNAALSEQYEQAAIEAQLIPSDARFACGRDFEMKLTYSNVRSCNEVLAALDQVFVELSESLRKVQSDQVEHEREREVISLELEEISRQLSATQASVDTLERDTAHRRALYADAREARVRELRKLERDGDELERVKATRESDVDSEQNALISQAEALLSSVRAQLDSVCAEYKLAQERAEADRAVCIEFIREQRKLLETYKRRVESGELQSLIQKWSSASVHELPQLAQYASQ